MAQHFPAQLAQAKCRCGHGIDHPSVEAKPVWGFFGWVKLLQGIDTLPKKVVYRCGRCGTVLGSTRDRETLRLNK